MATIPKVKVTFDADFDELKKGVKGASNEVEGFGSKVGDFAKKAGVAFAIAGAAAVAYAGKLLVDGVKSAIEDEAAQAKLATTLKNVAGATNAQIAATEAYITKTALAVGVTDDELRPSLERLSRATKDVEAAQKLQSLALDIAAGSGKSLEAVSAALAKGYEGNTASLGKLGVGLSAAQLKTMSFDEVTKALAVTFEGQANIQADTFAGKMERLNIAIDEGKETVGAFVLDAITPMLTTLVEDVIPVISEFAAGIGEKLQPVFANLTTFFTDTLIPLFKDWWNILSTIIIPGIIKTVTPILKGLFEAFSTIAKAITDNKEKLQPLWDLFMVVAKFVYTTLAPAIGTVLGGAFKAVGEIIGGVITMVANLVSAITNAINFVRQLIALAASIPDMIGGLFGGAKAAGGAVSSGTTYLVGERGPELFTPSSSGSIIPNNKLGGGSNTVININVSGALDSEGTARAIITALNNSYYRGTLGAGALVSA